MLYRKLGKTGFKVSEVSFGSWAIGGAWGKTNDKDSLAAMRRAIELGVNFFDTADVYGDGHSERLIAQTLKDFPNEEIYVATKAGRRLDPHVAEGYTKENLTQFVERSLKNLEVDAIDLLQLHCPPSEVYEKAAVFEILDDLQKTGKIKNYGVSVEKVSEALKAIEYPNVKTVQIIFNMFRLKPKEEFFAKAVAKKIGIIARVPLASGLLTGKMVLESKFEPDDHRNFNRSGEKFDRGETFSGVDFKEGLHAVRLLRKACPPEYSMTGFALKWILMHDAISCTIPGAKRTEQVEENISVSKAGGLTSETMKQVEDIYGQFIKRKVHNQW